MKCSSSDFQGMCGDGLGDGVRMGAGMGEGEGMGGVGMEVG